ncbi:MAG: phosphodiesterase [Roseiflexaceae bacterium]
MIIAQISDSHIGLGDDSAALRDKTTVYLRRAVEHLMRLPALPDVVLITGDCVDGGSLPEYQRFRTLISPLTMPVYVVPGNHDNREQLLALFGPQGSAPLAGFAQYVVDIGPVRLIALDTNVPGKGEGYLCAERLAWLEQRLAEAPERPTLIFMHHPPFLTGLVPLDKIGLTNADMLGAVITRHPQVERIVAGHVHSTMLRRFHGTLAMTCSSTHQQTFPDLHRSVGLAAIMEPPACLIHVWRESTGMITHTNLIGDYGPPVELHNGTAWVPASS